MASKLCFGSLHMMLRALTFCVAALGPEKIRAGKGISPLGAPRTLHRYPSVSPAPNVPEALGAAEAQKTWQRGGEPWSAVLQGLELLFRSPPPTLLCCRDPGGGPGFPSSGLHSQQRRPTTCPLLDAGLAWGRTRSPGSGSGQGWIPTRRGAPGGRGAAPSSPAAPGCASPTPSRSRCSVLEAALGGALATGLVD